VTAGAAQAIGQSSANHRLGVMSPRTDQAFSPPRNRRQSRGLAMFKIYASAFAGFLAMCASAAAYAVHI
jgi:hypothetical protein